ncbi:MAG: hypothetical protein JSV81_00015 [Anaerolineales bacterium]|nr:MAG: hypothetical protein JSV81_00015 [Anaerolineales bacterium]
MPETDADSGGVAEGSQNVPEQPLIEEMEVPSISSFQRPQIGARFDVADIRAYLAIGFGAILLLTVLFAFISVWVGVDWEQLKGLLDVLLPAETALLGSAVGFYFGSRKAGD